nr:hypothetical protein GCM10020185_27550 [Pseudomonas brassicacearum subsp. brassicacearum]
MGRRFLLGLLCCLAGTAFAAPAASPAPPHKAYLSLIIDDLGQNLPRDRRVLALPGPVTTAIMPDTPHAAEFAREAHRAGKLVMLHMPMDPATGPFAWHPELPIEELGKRLDAAFAAVPYTSGINNHMGSRMTAQPQAMAWLMANLQQRHKFFSSTAAPAPRPSPPPRRRRSASPACRGTCSWTTSAPKRPSPASSRPLSTWPAGKARP